MNLVRLGHYFTPAGGTGDDNLPNGGCRTALVSAVHSDTMVNLAVWEMDGTQFGRTSVSVAAPHEGNATFHLSGDCPWGR